MKMTGIDVPNYAKKKKKGPTVKAHKAGFGGGFRTIGNRKAALIEGPLNKAVEALSKRGMNPMWYLEQFYGVETMDDFRKIPTKKISGIISELWSIGYTDSGSSV